MNALTAVLTITALLLIALVGGRVVSRWRKRRLKMQREGRVQLDANKKILNYVCDYDPQSCSTFDEFQTIVQNTHCLFAKKAQIWASRPWDNQLSLEENIQRSVPTFIKWVTVGEYTNEGA